MNKAILIVDDDKNIQSLVRDYLSSNNYNVDCAKDGIEAISLYKKNKYNLIISEIMLPKLDGYSFCKMIRQKSDVPFIFMSRLLEEKYEIGAFDVLCDDYIKKPVSLNILKSRIEAVLRRYNKEESYLKFEDIKLNLKTYTIEVGGKNIDLTLKEFDILKTLIQNYPQVITRENLLDNIWGYDYYGDSRIVDAHIKNIRKKIVFPYIKTVKGIGYTLKKII